MDEQNTVALITALKKEIERVDEMLFSDSFKDLVGGTDIQVAIWYIVSDITEEALDIIRRMEDIQSGKRVLRVHGPLCNKARQLYDELTFYK